MLSRPEITILLITDTTVLRADFTGARKLRLIKRWQREVGVEASLSSAVDIAFGFNERVGRNVIVLSTAVWTQLVSVASLSITGMEPAELNQALKFEVEALSGIEVDDAELAVKATREIDGHQQFWVSELSAFELNEVVSKAVDRGARSVRIGHPAAVAGGVGRPAVSATGEFKQRLEFWPNLVCRIDTATELPVAISQSDFRGSRWYQDLGYGDVSDIDDSIQITASPGTSVPDSLSDRTITQMDDETIADSWLTNWARQVSCELSNPMLEVPRPSHARTWRLAASAVVAMLVAALCWSHWNFTGNQIVSLRAETERLQAPGQELNQLSGELSRVLGEKSKLEVELSELTKEITDVEFLLDVQNQRFDALLQLLLDLRTEDMVINRIEPNNLGLKVSGVSIYGQSAPVLATQLRHAAIPLGWEVKPPTQTGDNQMTSGGPFKFELILEDVGPNVATRLVNRVAANQE